MVRLHRLCMGVALLALVTACSKVALPPALRPDSGTADGQRLTAAFVSANRHRYQQAMERAARYLATFRIDPLALRAKGIKGQKKLVELLDAYVALHRYATGERRAALEKRFREVAAVAYRTEYHNMLTVGDVQFQQDATSYLRAAYLMDQMKLDVRGYRQEIDKAKARIDGHLPRRGPHQRMAFSFYYRHFGLARPPLLDQPLTASVIARRLAPERMGLTDAYDLTHEIFVPFDYGGDLRARPFSAEERAYLRPTLTALAARYAQPRSVDILGEILACIRYLGFHDLPAYRAGLEVLLRSQRENGSFGGYEQLRALRGELLELDFYLHTTSVALDILPLAFEGPP
jgi:hypothetical protein